VTWVVALILMAVALPVLLARLAGGYPPNPGPELAALAPLAVVPAVAAVIVAWFAARCQALRRRGGHPRERELGSFSRDFALGSADSGFIPADH